MPGTTQEEIIQQSGIQKNRNLPASTLSNIIPSRTARDGTSLVCVYQSPRPAPAETWCRGRPASPVPRLRAERGGRSAVVWGLGARGMSESAGKTLFSPPQQQEGGVRGLSLPEERYRAPAGSTGTPGAGPAPRSQERLGSRIPCLEPRVGLGNTQAPQKMPPALVTPSFPCAERGGHGHQAEGGVGVGVWPPRGQRPMRARPGEMR